MSTREPVISEGIEVTTRSNNYDLSDFNEEILNNFHILCFSLSDPCSSPERNHNVSKVDSDTVLSNSAF
ncbi:hypothetical protein AYI68_g4989 [Smittium mucronatum]|uniref:Uncharacterized protein n=1 Tax=Smittium mucronatum TaxID=133383 RepID=A0A1R0GVK7_9FUNG|nr:hypothetical protein AYI68_g4989 [Smittium mucronatum]